MHIAPGKKRKVGTATYANLTWEKLHGEVRRGSRNYGGGIA